MTATVHPIRKPPLPADPYRFAPAFERALIVALATRPKLWARVGAEVDPELLAESRARTALLAAGMIARELGRGAESSTHVVQRVRALVDAGKVTIDEARAVADLFADELARDEPEMSDDAIVGELRPILGRRIAAEVARSAIEGYSKGGKGEDFERVRELLARRDRLDPGAGDGAATFGRRLAPDVAAEIDRVRELEKLGFGVPDLDDATGGGLRRGCLGIALGATGGGKSMVLSHLAAWGARCGLAVAYATLELGPTDVMVRILANLSGETIDRILTSPLSVVDAVVGMPDLGPVVVQEFTPQVTTFQDIEAWVAVVEAELGRPIDLLLTDYGDKLVAPRGTSKKEAESSYYSSRVVFERMRVYAATGHPGGPIWHWTASAATRPKDTKRRLLGTDDAADSLHKVRVADMVLTLNPEADEMMTFVLAKHRHGGRTSRPIGPLPTDFSRGRIAPIVDLGGSGRDLAFAALAASSLREAP